MPEPEACHHDGSTPSELPRVAGFCGQPQIFNRHADRKVIQALECVPLYSKRRVNRIVVEAADTRSACAGRFGFQIEHLADDTRFPEQVSIEGGALIRQTAVEFRDHPEAEKPIRCDRLITAETLGSCPADSYLKPPERQLVADLFPQELWMK